jgi:hypothetical protein
MPPSVSQKLSIPGSGELETNRANEKLAVDPLPLDVRKALPSEADRRIPAGPSEYIMKMLSD